MPDSKKNSELQRLLNHDPFAEMEKENPWKNDIAERKQFAYKFVTLIENIGAESNAVILLDGEWGTGKTYFLKSFRQELDNRKYKAIYFDAYAEDFSSDPLVAICGQLWKELNIGKSFSTKKELINILKDILNISVEKTVGKVTDKKDINTLGLGLLSRYVKSRRELEELKNNLSSMVTKNQNEKEGKAKPLVFIIDELDRCRPTFALELLERVKHLFRVPGIIFILGANTEALIKSMKMEYGEQKPEYFEKFFDWRLVLPNVIRPADLAKQFIDELPHRVFAKNFGDQDHEDKKLTDTFVIKDLYYPLIDYMEFTLREVEISTKLFMLCLLLMENSSIRIVDDILYKIATAVCLVVLKVKRADLYNDIVQGKDSEAIIVKMNAVFENEKIDTEPCCRIFNSAIYCLSIGQEREIITDSEFLKGENVEDWEKIREIISSHKISRSEFVAILENLHCGDYPSEF